MAPLALLLLTLLLLLLCLLSVPAAAQPAPWPVARANYQRTALSPFIGPRGSWTRGESWRATLGGDAFALAVDVQGNAVVQLLPDAPSSASSIGISSSGPVVLTGGSSSATIAASASSSGTAQRGGRAFASGNQHAPRRAAHRARREAEPETAGGSVAWLDAAGDAFLTMPAPPGLTLAVAVAADSTAFFVLAYDAANASYTPTLSMARIAANASVPQWSAPLPQLFAGLTPPLNAHLDHLPVSDVLLVSAWQANSSLATFAGVAPASGAALWISSSFVFAPAAAPALSWALAADEATAYTVKLTSKGLEACAWSVDFAAGNFSRLWRTRAAKATQEGAVGYAVLDAASGALYATYSPAATPALLWALNASDGATLWQLPFQSAIAGIALGPGQQFWLATADGFISLGYRSAQNLTIMWRQSLCPGTAPMQSPIADATGAAYIACGSHVVGLYPNGSACFGATSHGGQWLGPATPAIAGPALLYAVAQHYAYAWRNAQPPPPAPPPPHLKEWEVIALSVGSPLLFLWLLAAVVFLSLRESPQEEEAALLQPIYSAPSLCCPRFMAYLTLCVCLPYGRSALQRLRNAERFAHDNDYAKARRAARRSVLYALKGHLLGLPLVAALLALLLWLLVSQQVVAN